MRRVLITGASGFIGGHIAHFLHTQGAAVRCLVRPQSRLDFLRTLAPELALGDVTEPASLRAALDGVEAVVHCAGVTRARSRTEYFRINEGGTRNLLAACAEWRERIRRIVHISSLAAFGPAEPGRPITERSIPRPVGNYGESKLAAQQVVDSFGADLPISTLVPPAVYGPRDKDFLAYFKLVQRRMAPRIGGKERHLSLVYVTDLARAVSMLLSSENAAGRSYLVNDGRVHSWTGVAEAIGRALMRRPRYIYLPVCAVRSVGVLGDLLAAITGRTALIRSEKVREILQTDWTCASDRIQGELGFRPQFPLDSGIRETLAWYLENRWLRS